MLIAIDHGNKQMKTRNLVFTSGLTESDNPPPFGDSILEYKGKYYTTSEQRIPYLRDKTVDNRFYILTLYAIACEIEEADCYSEKEIMDVQLVVGLPPAHYGTLAKKFEGYFMRGGQVEEFKFRGKPYSIYINEVMSFPQAHAAAVSVYGQIKHYNKLMVVDIGGFTVDYLQINNGKPDRSVCDSLEYGVIRLYNDIKSKINADFDLLLEESDIDTILQDEPSEYDDKIKSIVAAMSQSFISNLLGNLRERMIDLRTGKTVFVGGGSILLKKQIVATDKVINPVFVEQISANVRGYELLYKSRKAKDEGYGRQEG